MNYPIITFYLAKLFSRQFLLSFLIIVATLITANIFETLQKFKSYPVKAGDFWFLVIYKMPYLFNEVSLVVGFIATLLFMQIIRKNHELVVLLSSGIPIWKIFIVPIVLTAIYGGLMLLFINPLSSYGLKRYEKLESRITGKVNANLIIASSGIFIYEKGETNNKIIQAKSIDLKNNKIFNLTILVSDADNRLLYRIDSPLAVLEDNKFKFSTVLVTYDDHTDKLQDYELYTKLAVNKLVQRFRPPELINLWQLNSTIENIVNSGLSAIKYQLFYYKQIFKPLAMVALATVACWFVGINTRESNIKAMIAAIAIGICGYLFLELAFRILAYSGISVFLAVLLPIAFIILVSNFVILHLQEA